MPNPQSATHPKEKTSLIHFLDVSQSSISSFLDLKDLFGGLHIYLSCRCELNRVVYAFEQLSAEIRLEFFQSLAQSRLCDKQLFCCTGDVLLLGNGYDVFQLIEIQKTTPTNK